MSKDLNSESCESLKPIAVKLGVPNTSYHIIQRIDELNLKVYSMDQVFGSILSEVNPGSIYEENGFNEVLIEVIKFRKNHYKLKARANHLHELCYENIFKIIVRRAHGFFIYPITNFFEKRKRNKK